jgi:PBP1b-binding outer membrane lipoprotein LpoB
MTRYLLIVILGVFLTGCITINFIPTDADKTAVEHEDKETND